MEYIVLFAALFLLFIVYAVRCVIEDRRKMRAFEQSLHTGFGQPSGKSYPKGRLDTIAGHYRKQNTAYSLDDITWNDLEMDRVFRQIDFTFSSAGEEALYTLLRCPCSNEEELQKRENLISYFMEHEEERVKLQMFFAKIGKTGKYSIYDYVSYLDNLPARKNTKHYVVLALMLAAVMLCFFEVGTGLPVLCVLFCYNMISYFAEKKEIDPYITTFGYFLRVLAQAQQLAALRLPAIKEQMEEIEQCRKKFESFRRFSFLLMYQNTMSGNPLEILFDYVRMGLHLNLIKFNQMLGCAKKNQEDMIRIIEVMGYIEAMLSIGNYRASMPYYCIPEFSKDDRAQQAEKKTSKGDTGKANTEKADGVKSDSEYVTFCADGIYHPLISSPVANSVQLEKGMLLTGSNASGKSTFLKTIAIAQIFAQTIHTVPAQSFVTSFYRVYSSMALRDDLASKDSYFIVEIKSLKRIIDAAEEPGKMRIMCFVDEVLRGTNTVERIAAASEILSDLVKKGVFCFAATHDIELTQLLETQYENYHFEETIEGGDVIFPYMLCKGKAESRNAIRLLGVLGYEKQIIRKAEQRAEHFIESGEWK